MRCPGLGGSVVDWIAYGHVVQTAKDKSQFGQGDIRGVLAPESANNAKEGGALIPTLLFGIPGSGGMAVFLGGMILIGMEPGPSMVGNQLDVTYAIIWSLALANVIGAGSCPSPVPCCSPPDHHSLWLHGTVHVFGDFVCLLPSYS